MVRPPAGGAAKALFYKTRDATGLTQYAVSPDGQQFLMNRLIEDLVTTPVTLILNWKPKP